jgi:4-aminobutyrate aminotransferase-like enzyme
VLDVVEDESVVDHARETGEYLRSRLREVTAGSEVVREVRGMGLATGVEVTDAITARDVVEGLRRLGVLVGTCGAGGNVLKVRPPLVFRRPHADQLVTALAQVLAERG